ncbi:MAG TPA: hypothetical protein VGO47_05460 [Chlamydiales bacterium]|nr:hypothetical protein [Chlamydiales bacterium]
MLAAQCETTEAGLKRHYVFLEALFLNAVIQLEDYEKGDPETIAEHWYKWMKAGSTPQNVGSNRRMFYSKVVDSVVEVGIHVMIMGLLIMLLVGMVTQGTGKRFRGSASSHGWPG